MSGSSKKAYAPVAADDTYTDETKSQEDKFDAYNDSSDTERQGYHTEPPKKSRLHGIGRTGGKIVALAILAFFVYEMWDFFSFLKIKLEDQKQHTAVMAPAMPCTSPATRPSWNHMSRGEKKSYIDAVLCMTEQPSHIHPNSSVYDDFTYIHIIHGDLMHFAAGNLPWHRLHLFSWEQALRRECGYGGQLPYWEWELEYDDPYHSPIFDNEIGFGGDGDQSRGPVADKDAFTLDESRCIQSGPFVHLRPQWYAEFPAEHPLYLEFRPHCITRAFTESFKDPEARPGTYAKQDFSPSRIDELMEVDDYSEFNDAVEEVHNWVPQTIRGDYASLAAPNDPTFYLHLTNIDRLWWQWQQRHGKERLMAYGGEAERKMGVNASLADPLPFEAYPGMVHGVTARDMMDAQSGVLGMCYQY